MTDRKIGDIDIDFADRRLGLAHIRHTTASMIRNGKIEKHNSGVYLHTVPTDPVTGYASMHYETAEQKGWYKIDLLNMHVYEKVRDESHLIELMNTELNWTLLEYSEFTEKLVQLGNHAKLVAELKPKSIVDLAMVIALIRPAKRHLIRQCQAHGFDSIKDEIWLDVDSEQYKFRKSHAISYAMLIKIHANILVEETMAEPTVI